MLVLPGPGWGAIILGIVVLASEFAWAQRLLVPVRAVARRGLNVVHPMPRRRAILATAISAASFGVALLASRDQPARCWTGSVPHAVTS